MTQRLHASRILVGALALAGLCAIGTAVAATKPPATTKPAAAKSTKKAPAKPVETAPTEATTEQVAAAERVFYGAYDCEFNQTVHIDKNAKYGSYVDVKSGKSTWTMKPVLSSTGAIRLEDVKGETLMVQISSKSMLLNVKTAQRIVDACVCPQQRELVAAAAAAKATQNAVEATSAGAVTAAAEPAGATPATK